MVFKSTIRWAFVFLLVAIFIYWTITAYIKYESEPVSTSLEHRLGDDDLGNFTLPVISFCRAHYNESLDKSPHLKKCNIIHRQKILTDGMTNAAIDCMQDYDNISDFLEAIKIDYPSHKRKNVLGSFCRTVDKIKKKLTFQFILIHGQKLDQKKQRK